MNICKRLKYLRETENLTTRAFGETINLSGGAITNMEKGRRTITERTIKDICRVYNVNPDWMTSGNGAMYNDTVNNLDVNNDVKQLAKIYSFLNDNDKMLVKNMINSLSEKVSQEIFNKNNNDPELSTEKEKEIQKEGEAYMNELRLEANMKIQEALQKPTDRNIG